ncbi:hypothetical protein [uncultured Microbacterium sp.]|uniref:MarR family winged helix-turn-helix transcriptional regulator n=1 Tax=uncultured Microbacterium sp. TaxID=191216 RepID=UPI0028D799BC|nr:hypothetical protein [uncultured Microbacterium sp.]
MNTPDTQNASPTSRPFGYWLKAVDRLMAAEFDTAFEGEHASRRDWRMLNIIDGTAPARRPLNAHKLRGLVERGWIAADDAGWTLTDEGREAKQRLGVIVDGIRTKVSDAVSPEDLETTLASLEQIARAFGWDEETPLPRGRGRRHGFGRTHGFGPGRGFGHRPGHPFGRAFGPGFGGAHEHATDAEFGHRDCGHRGHPGHARFADTGRAGHGHAGVEHGHTGHTDHGHPGAEHGADHDHARGHVGHEHGRHEHGRHGASRHGGHRFARAAQDAYERGFDAGFSRGRDA